MPDKPLKPARKRAAASTRARTTRARAVDHSDIATRAYYIHLDEGSNNDVENWLRAERELTAT